MFNHIVKYVLGQPTIPKKYPSIDDSRRRDAWDELDEANHQNRENCSEETLRRVKEAEKEVKKHALKNINDEDQH